MDDRRRPTIFGLSLLSLAMVSPFTLATSLTAEAPARSLRTLVPDAMYAAGVTADFSNLQLRDEMRAPLKFAICPLHEIEQARVKVPLLAVPDLARPTLNSAGELIYERPAGAGPIDSLAYWILDLRDIDTPIRELHGAPQVNELRDSPSLRQWSAPIRFTQTDDTLQLGARPLKFVRLEPASPLPWPQTKPTISVNTLRESAQRKPHWFQPQPTEKNRYDNQRELAVIAARINNPQAAGPVVLQSRQGAWDAWKPRGRWDAARDGQILRFSGVTDPQWRVIGLDAGGLELAHAAHELRIDGLSPQQRISLHVAPAEKRATSVSCLNDERWPELKPLSWRQLKQDEATAAAEEPSNLRGGFLVILAIVLAGIFGIRHFRRNKAN